MHSTLWVVKRAFIILMCFAFGASCYAPADEPALVAAAVGPSPLRRLTNSELLNALHDLFPAVIVPLPPLPKDAEVLGFDNAAEVQQPSDLRIARFESIANTYAAALTQDEKAVRALTGCDFATPTAASACADQFVRGIGRALFRRPLLIDEYQRFSQKFESWRSAIGFEGAVRLTVSAMLQTPQFLYRPELSSNATVELEAYAMASRLSFFLWESVPDALLLAAAEKNELRTTEQIRSQTSRMLKHERARRSLWSFHRQWLGLERVLGDEHVFRTAEIDSGWTAETPLAASKESQLFVENVLFEQGTLRDLLTSRRAWLNPDMARIYGVAAPNTPGGSTPAEIALPENERAGILTRAAFLAGLSHRGGTSPPIRGNAVGLRMLCRTPISPPPDADLSMPVAPAGSGPQTNRGLFEARTAPATCKGCHGSLNGIGFGFENYNAAGAFQKSENGIAIDARGELPGTDVDGRFDGALQLSARLAESEQVYACATERWLRYAFGRAPSIEEEPAMATLARSFAQSRGDVRALMLAIATLPSFRMQRGEAK
jgi:hypothetical protein